MFPSRDESLLFRQELETIYRDDLARLPNPTYVDLEGDVVWVQEYLRYRLNGCSHQQAQDKVMQQIDGLGIAPVCRTATGNMTGTWTGELIGAPISVTLTQFPGGVVTGTWEQPSLGFHGEVGPSGEPGSVSEDGQFELRFKVLAGGAFIDFFYRGSISADGQQLTGRLDDSGFDNQLWILDRQN